MSWAIYTPIFIAFCDWLIPLVGNPFPWLHIVACFFSLFLLIASQSFTNAFSPYLPSLCVAAVSATLVFVRFNERWLTGQLRFFIFFVVHLSPPCDATLDPLCDPAKISKSATSTTPRRSLRRRKIKHVMVTGATGFTGVHLIRHLLTYYPSWKVSLLSRRSDPASTYLALLATCKKYNVTPFSTQELNSLFVVKGDFKKPNLGLSEAQLNDAFEGVDAVFHLAMSTSYIVPYEANRIWAQNLAVLCRACLAHSVELHCMGGSGYHITEDCKSFDSKKRGLWMNGYFQFKQFQVKLLNTYSEHTDLISCTYDVPYIVADDDGEETLTPALYETALIFKIFRHFGSCDHYDLSIVTPQTVSWVLCKNAEMDKEFKSTYMNFFEDKYDFDGLSRVGGFKQTDRDTIKNRIRDKVSNVSEILELYESVAPSFWVGTPLRPVVAPDWVREYLDELAAKRLDKLQSGKKTKGNRSMKMSSGDGVLGKFVSQTDSDGFSICEFRDNCFYHGVS
ncbi:hypothetical protein TrST_g9604 [Triparma strigata]|uniref:Thioester reductase (TE) domain-containing protein n=1 Tax=Triparma strigata TaxID=1606541 RepID=A0A9W7DX47_9STRA|nr:hypothetical protein TrST_g9604 [Triparma strigata]